MENDDLKTFLKNFEETLKKNNIKRCSKKEFEIYELLLKNDNPKLLDKVQKYFHIRAVNIAFSHPAYELRYFVYPIIMSGKSEEEIIRLLDLLSPKGWSFL